VNPWDAERVVSPGVARALARRHVAADEIVPLGAGWDNTAYLVDGAWVFRFPRRALAVPLLAREVAVLPAIAPRLPLPITAPEHHGLDADGWPYAGYRHLRGDVLATSGHEPGPELGATLGAFVRALHALSPAGLELGGDAFGKVDAAARHERLRARAQALGVGVPEAVIAAALAVPLAGRAPVVAHGDLDGRHVVGAGERAYGVIDWGDVHLGDRASDLALAWSALAGRARAAFLAAYGEVDAATAALARLRAIDVALAVIAWGIDVGDARAEDGGRRSLSRALAP